MGRRLTSALVTGLVAFAVHPAGSAEYKISQGTGFRILHVSGPFQQNEQNEFIRHLSKRNDIGEVWFDSPGGSLGAGIKIGEYIRDRGLATRIVRGSSCASSCFYAFIGGVSRIVDDGGRVGVHMATLARNDNYISAIKNILLDPRISSVDTKIAFIVMANEQYAAQGAGMQAMHIVRMGVSLRVMDKVFETDHIDMHWLNRRELIDYNVVN